MSETVLSTILRNCERYAEKTALHWLDKECEVVRKLSYSEIDGRTREIATKLFREFAVKRGERVVLCYPPGLEFIEAFLACFRAGVIAGETLNTWGDSQISSFFSCRLHGHIVSTQALIIKYNSLLSIHSSSESSQCLQHRLHHRDIVADCL